MPRPRITEPEITPFKQAIASFNGMTLEKVHKKIFLRVIEIIERERIPIDSASEQIALILKVSREEVKVRLKDCQPLKPFDRPSRPRPEAWPSVKNAQKDIK